MRRSKPFIDGLFLQAKPAGYGRNENKKGMTKNEKHQETAGTAAGSGNGTGNGRLRRQFQPRDHRRCRRQHPRHGGSSGCDRERCLQNPVLRRSHHPELPDHWPDQRAVHRSKRGRLPGGVRCLRQRGARSGYLLDPERRCHRLDLPDPRGRDVGGQGRQRGCSRHRKRLGLLRLLRLRCQQRLLHRLHPELPG